MSALRIFATSRPSGIGAPVLPMSKDDREFWRLLAERRKVAAGLSKRERELLLWLDRFRLLPKCFSRWNLRRKGLIQPWLFKGSWDRTIKGEAVANSVRRELEKEKP